ncbi:sigma-70 family RNA polymerase sigma factor [Streptomyces sp. NPDC018833]|uniref:sigma-70 family RNA polymerase sigma factor n=1 Tax=Streptomyces sp. NPDC018833 TaxID=3365053 RepID=UPI0037BD5A11
MREIPDSGPSGIPADRWQQIWNHRKQLLKVAQRRSMSLQDAEDAVHEAMARAAERPHLDASRLGAWLTSVTIRLCIDQHRQLSRDAGICRRVGSTLTVPSTVPHEEAVCDRAEARWLALQSVELPKNQVEALRLKAQDLDVAQVAQRMGLTYKAAESLLGRARRTLRAALAATLAVVVGMWRGRPRLVGGTPTAAPPAVLASTAVTLMIAGLVLTSPSETDGVIAPRPDRDQRSGAVNPASHDKPDLPASRRPTPVSDPQGPGALVLPGPAGRAVGNPPTGSGPTPADGFVPEQPQLPGQPSTGLPTLPPVPPLPIPAEPDVVVRPDDAVPVPPYLPGPPSSDVLPQPLL